MGRLTVLAGPNGVGKSTLLEALQLSLEAAHSAGDWNRVGGRILEMVSAPGIGRSGDPVGGIICGVPGHQWSAGFDSSNPTVHSFRYFEDGKELPADGVPRGPYPRPRSVRLRAEALRQASDLTEVPHLRADGGNLAAVLARLTQLRDGRIEQIEEAFRNIVPTVRRVFTENRSYTRPGFFEPHAEVTSLAAELFIEFDHLGRIPAAEVSSGTLLALGLLTACHGEGAQLLLIDDAEQGLHMEAQRALMAAIRDVLAQTPELQVVLSTHSPFIMGAAEVDEIALFGLHPDGRAIHGRLDQHPHAERLLELLSPAELWSTEGEGWLAPAP